MTSYLPFLIARIQGLWEYMEDMPDLYLMLEVEEKTIRMQSHNSRFGAYHVFLLPTGEFLMNYFGLIWMYS